MKDLKNWNGCARPERVVLEGRFCRLEPLNAAHHGDELFIPSSATDSGERFLWLPEYPPKNRKDFQPWLKMAQESADPLYFVVIDKATGKVEGRQTLMRIDDANGVAEIGNIFWGGEISKTPVTTEAYYLFANYILGDLSYRRFEWKCNNNNVPSKRSALRYGMTAEGLFRQALVVKGENRDTAWFSLLDHEWPEVKAAFEAWLTPENFDEDGKQIRRLEELRTG